MSSLLETSISSAKDDKQAPVNDGEQILSLSKSSTSPLVGAVHDNIDIDEYDDNDNIDLLIL